MYMRWNFTYTMIASIIEQQADSVVVTEAIYNLNEKYQKLH